MQNYFVKVISVKAYNQVQRSSIINCWNKADIIVSNKDESKKLFESAAYREQQENMLIDLKAELQKYALKINKTISSAEKYLYFEKYESIGDTLTDEDIIELVKSTYIEEREENEEIEEKE
jgi:hypothetical protein